jgi:hypothetical protein
MQALSDSRAGMRTAPGWLRAGLTSTLVLGLCWGTEIAWWRGSGHPPAAGASTAALLVLPLALLFAFWGMRRLAARPAAAEAAAAVPAAPAHRAPPAPRAPVLAMLGTALRLPHGASSEQLAVALAGQRARVDLDPELIDDDCFPIISARSKHACDEALQDDIAAWLAAQGMADPCFSDEQRRALTLATQVTAELAQQAAGLWLGTGKPVRLLRLILLLPPEWHPAQRLAVSQWLKHTVTQAGWPPAQVELAETTPTGANADADPNADTGGASPVTSLNRLAHEAVLANAPMNALVVACASHVGAQTVARWVAQDSLFSAEQPRGQIPGEGAAGLLLADERQMHSIAGTPFVRLEALQEERRPTSADADEHVDPKPLASLVRRALEHARIAPTDIALVVADTGLRSNRVLELMAGTAALSQLDTGDDFVRIGLACGNCDVVPFIAALALARHHALGCLGPVLCVSNEDPFRRIVAAVRPAQAQARELSPAPPRSHSTP